MGNPLLNPEIQSFINNNIGNDIAKMALQKNTFQTQDWIEILNQIAAKTKAKTKLPTYFQTENILYPSKVSIEQTSSEKAALYKSEIVSGEKLIDLTGGFGVDDYFFSKKIKKVIHCEINADLSKIVNHNFKQLIIKNIQCLSGDSTVILEQLNQNFDWIYIDPSRRNDTKGKVFMLKDCLPNVPDLLNLYFRFSTNILIKTAPILDITAALSELKNVKTIHIIAIENEVKELLFEIEKDFDKEIFVKTINISKKNDIFVFRLKNNIENCNFGKPKKYLFEPNAAIMKSGAFNEISNHFKLDKLHKNSHLFTSDSIIEFCGRVFEITNQFEYNKKNMKTFLENKKANVTIRNFSETVDDIRKKWKINVGGNIYCFFTTDLNNKKIVLITVKI
jgi:hypothetical protein